MDKVFILSLDVIKIAQFTVILFTVCSLIYLFKKKRQEPYLFILLSILLLATINSFVIRFIDYSFPNFIPALILAFGPTLYYYISENAFSNPLWEKAYLRHLILMPIFAILSMIHFSDFVQFWLVVFVIIHFGIYLITTINTLAKKKFVVLSKSMELKIAAKKWTNDFYLIIVAVFVYTAVIIESFFVAIRMIYRFTYIVLFLGVLFLIIRRIVVKAITIYREAQKNRNTARKEKYKDSILSKVESKKLAARLEKVMDTTKPYLDDELDLKTLALLVKIHPKSLSQVINENFGKNFFDYVNHYRIEVAKKMLRDPAYKDHKIYEIMYEVGFNSRSSFNTAFKKFTEQTARSYRSALKS